MANVLSKIRSRLASKPKMAAAFEEKVLPIAKDVRADMAGKPEPQVYAELKRRLEAAGVDTSKHDDKVHAAAARISKAPAR